MPLRESNDNNINPKSFFVKIRTSYRVLGNSLVYRLKFDLHKTFENTHGESRLFVKH